MRFNWKHRIVVPFLCRKWVKVNVREISELGEKPRHATNLNINVGPSFVALPTIVRLFSIIIFSGKLNATYWSPCDRLLLTGFSLLLSIQFYLLFHWLCFAVTVGAGCSRTSLFGAPTSENCCGVNFKWRILFLVKLRNYAETVLIRATLSNIRDRVRVSVNSHSQIDCTNWRSESLLQANFCRQTDH